MPRQLIDKKSKKHVERKCLFCGVEDYAVLDVHRIVPEADGGRYTEMNSVVSCACCHRRIHDGQIVIDRKYFSTSGRWLLHCWVNGEEKYL